MTICKTCFTDKRDDEFYSKDKSCKECRKEKVRKYREENIDKILAYDKKRANLPHRVSARAAYAKTPQGIAASNKAKLKWSSHNKIQKGASQLVNNAVRNGKIIKPERCSECGKYSNRIHGHHDDYAFPLSVRWLCSKCHRSWHKLNGPGLNTD
jgi:ribosomal protein S27AE